MDSLLGRLHAVSANPLVGIAASPLELDEAARYGWPASGLVSRALRGRRMRSSKGLVAEFSAAFGWTFGRADINVMTDYMTDLDWLPFRGGLVIGIWDANEVLSEDADLDVGILTQWLFRWAGRWARSVHEGQPWDHDPIPFHVVLQDPDGNFDQWHRHGVQVPTLPHLNEQGLW